MYILDSGIKDAIGARESGISPETSICCCTKDGKRHPIIETVLNCPRDVCHASCTERSPVLSSQNAGQSRLFEA